MKKLTLIFIGLFLVPTLFLTSCDEGEESVYVEPTFTTLKNYMINNGYDTSNIITNDDGEKFVVAAPATDDYDAFIAKYYIIDIRSSDDFNNGHIYGAKNVAFSTILDEGANAASAGKPALVVCYTGQTACYATALMRMYGYTNTRALKWGMSGWNETTAGSWNSKIGAEEANGHANWSYDSAPSNLVFSDPDITSLKTDGEEILKSRVELVVSEGFKTASGTDVLNNPDDYFINNYFSETDYGSFGHIAGAYRILPLTLADNSYLNLDSSSSVVTYCYTGQTSAVMTAVLRVLGYDAYSMTFGMNGIYNTNTAWASNQWGVDSNPKSLTLIVED